MKKTYKLLFYISLCLLSFSVLSCSDGGIGYGIVLWPDEDSPLTAGKIYTVKTESDINDEYSLRFEETKDTVDIDRWRVEFHEKKADALEFAAGFRDFSEAYGRAEKDGLALRDKPATTGRQVYRARYREVMKILKQTSVRETILGHEDFWYLVLTETGTRAYRFGLNMKIFNINESTEEDENADEMARIKQILRNSYYTQHVAGLISANTIDLDLVNPVYGFFPDIASRTLAVRTPDYSFQASWDSINYVGKINGRDRFSFPGANFTVTVYGNDEIYVNYTYNSREYSERYVIIDDLQEIIAEEELRREQIYLNLYSTSPELVSATYGKIILSENGSFKWTENQNLVPGVLNANTGSAGWIIIQPSLSPLLQRDYDGALTFRFSTGQQAVFIYQKSSSGLRFVYINDDLIEDRIVISEPSVKIIAFFEYAENF